MNGRSSIGLLVVKSSDANIVETAQARQERTRIGPRVPSCGRASRPSPLTETIFINSSLAETQPGSFSRHTRHLARAVSLFAPRAIFPYRPCVDTGFPLVSTFFMMYVCGFTLNIVSTMALALCIGILVDDSIVVLENIHRHRQLGKDPATAARSRAERKSRWRRSRSRCATSSYSRRSRSWAI